MTEQIENEGFERVVLDGELYTPNARQHLFTTIDAACDFAKTFKLKQFNVRYGQDVNGRMVYQLIYAVENN